MEQSDEERGNFHLLQPQHFRLRTYGLFGTLYARSNGSGCETHRELQILDLAEEHGRFLYYNPPVEGCDKSWVQAVPDIAQFENLRFKRLVVDVKSQRYDFHFGRQTFNIELRTRRWTSALRETFSGLDMLGINYACSRRTCYEFTITNECLDMVHQAEEDLWKILVSYMLRKENDNHDGSTLQHRRIYDKGSSEDNDSSSEEDEETSSTSELWSGPDREEKEEEDDDDRGDKMTSNTSGSASESDREEDEEEIEDEDLVADAEEAITEVEEL